MSAGGRKPIGQRLSEYLSSLRGGGHRLSWAFIKNESGLLVDSGREYFSPSEDLKDPDAQFMSTRRIIGAGRLVTFLLVVGFFSWAAFAPLASAIIAPGVIEVETHVKTIQHLEGGIVRQVLVHDGQFVHTNQPLIRLDDTQARASLALLQDQSDALEAQEARLEAVRDGRDTITFPPDLMKRANDPKVAQALQGEQNAFAAQKETLTKQIDIINNRSSENSRIIAGYKDEEASVEKQMKLIAQETASVQSLYAKGLSTLPRLLQLQRQAADLSGQRSQLSEKIAQTQLTSGENEMQIMNLKNQQQSDIEKELREVQAKRFDVLDRIQAAQDVLSRLTLRAPVAGKVANLSVHTVGAVVKPGDPLMEIVPQKDTLEVEAHVRPEDADSVYAGMTARVNLSAYQARRLPIILGTVKNVSADRQVDQRTGQAYFTVTVSVDRTPLKDYPDVKLIPGLPVDVSLETGSRTALDYLVEPITDVFRKGMKEK